MRSSPGRTRPGAPTYAWTPTLIHTHPHPSPAPGPATTCGVPAHTTTTGGTTPGSSPTPADSRSGPLPGGTRLHPRQHHRPSPRVRPARYPAAKAGLPTLTDKGHNPPVPGSASSPRPKATTPATDTPDRGTSSSTGYQHPPERGNAPPLETTFAALRRVTVYPQRIGHILAAALVLLTLNHKTR